MSEHADTLKSMLQDIINDRQEQAAVTMHDYFVAKSREVAGLSSPTDEDTITDDDDTSLDDDSTNEE